MKKAFLMIALALVSSTAALADDCSNIMGDFQCSMEGQQVPLSISRPQADSVKVTIAGEGEMMITDGAIHKSAGDDSQYVATCKQDTGLQALYTFKTSTQSISITATAHGVKYSIDRGGQVISLECAKK